MNWIITQMLMLRGVSWLYFVFGGLGMAIRWVALERMQALPLEPGVWLHFVLESAGLETVLEYASAGNLVQYADQAFVSELTH